jgi:hypothetical protein
MHFRQPSDTLCSMKTSAKRSGNDSRTDLRSAKGKQLRVIAEAAFKGNISAKVLDAAIMSVMAKRKPEAESAVHLRDREIRPLTSATDR